jgi:hypothetical protein
LAVKGKKPPKKLPKNYNRSFLIDSLLDMVDKERGVSKATALRELRSMLAEETPPVDIELDIAFVPIVFDGEAFHADKSKAIKV